MSQCLVLQSCPAPEAQGWLQTCMDSVQAWCAAQGFTYRFIDDELFSVLPQALKPGGHISPVIASDLARLRWLQQLLQQGYEQVVWLDADVLVFAPDELGLPDADCAVGREVWVQQDADKAGWKAWKKVHNAFLMARDQGQGRNSFLDFYADTAQRLLLNNQQGMPAQFIGPKLLTALHNVVQFPVLEELGMLSPAVVEDLLGADNGALRSLKKRSVKPMYAANLCRSSLAGEALQPHQMDDLVGHLLSRGLA